MNTITIPIMLEIAVKVGGQEVQEKRIIDLNESTPLPLGRLLARAKAIPGYRQNKTSKGSPRGRHHVPSQEIIEEMKRLATMGRSLKQIGAATGFCANTVRNKIGNFSKHWNEQEISFLRENWKQDPETTCKALGRTYKSCEIKFQRLEVDHEPSQP